MADLEIPTELRPADGRFGCGPSKVRSEAVTHLAEVADGLLGTSHRKAGVKGQVRRIREGLATFFDLPEGYEVVLGAGGATLFWDAAAFGLVRERSAHAVLGEFSQKFSKVCAGAPHLADPVIVEAPYGSAPELEAVDGVDLYALTHCETSTGVAMPLRRPAGADGLVAVDATSAAGGLAVDLEEVDAYYFSPQKCFASEGGLFVALLSPAALARVEELAASDRWIPPMLDLATAVDNSRKDQTYNTPSVSTLFLMAEQIDWMNEGGGIAWAAEQCKAKADHLYGWAEDREWASPFVTDPGLRSNVVCTIDLDERVDAGEVSAILRANGMLDTEAYRKLGRNQLRVAVFPAVDLADVEALTGAVDYVVDALS